MQASLGAGGGGVVDMATGGPVDDSRGWGGGLSCQEDGDVRGQRNGGGGQNGRQYVGRGELC